MATEVGSVKLNISIDEASIQKSVVKAMNKASKVAEAKALDMGNKISKSMAKDFGGFENASRKALRNVEKESNRVASSLNSGLGGTLKKLGKLALTVFGVKALINFGKECLELGSQLIEIQNVVDQTFKGMSKDIDEWASNSIEKMGMNEATTKRYASVYGAVLNSLGTSQQDVFKMSTNLTQLTADLASFYNLDTENAFEKLKSGITGEIEPLRKLGIYLGVANLEEYALSQGITKSYNAMTEKERAMLRYNYILESTKDIQNDFIRTSNSWANQTRILNQRFSEVKTTIGQGLMNALLPVLKMLNLLIGRLSVFATKFEALTARIFGKAELSSNGALENLGDDLSNISIGADGASESIDGVTESLKKASKNIFGFDELNVLQDKDDGSSGGDIGVGEIGSADTLLGSNEPQGPSILEQIADKLNQIDFTNLINSFNHLKESVMPVVDTIGNGLKWVWDNILVPFGKWTIEEALPSTMNALSGAFELIGKVAENVGPKLEAIWNNFLKPIMGFVGDAITSALDAIGVSLSDIAKNETAVDILGDLVIALGGIMLCAKVSTIIMGIATAITTLGTSLKILATGGLLESTSIFAKLGNVMALVAGGAGTLHEAMTLVFGKVATILAGIGTVIAGAVIAVKNFFGMWENGWNVLQSIFMAIGVAIAAVGAIILGAPAFITGIIAAIIAVVANLVIVVKDNWESIKTFTINVFTAIGKFFSDCWNGIKDTVSNLINTLVTTIKRNWEGLKEATSLIFDAIGNFLTGCWNWIKDTVSNLITNIVNFGKQQFENFKNGLVIIFNAIKDFLIGCWNNIKKFFTETIPAIVNFVIEKWEAFKTKISSILTIVKNFIIGVWNNIKNSVSEAITNIVNFGKERFENLKTNISNIFNAIKTFITNLWTSIVTFVTEKVTNFKNNVINGFNLIKDGAINIFNGMKDKITTVFSNLVGIVKSPINTIISLVNKAIDGINSFSIDVPEWVEDLTGIGTFGFNIPKIPQLANGGLVTSPTLAMVGEGKEDEIVSPLSMLRQIENEGSSETNALLGQMIEQNKQLINIMSLLLSKDTDVYLDRDKVGAMLTNYQNSESRRRG